MARDSIDNKPSLLSMIIVHCSRNELFNSLGSPVATWRGSAGPDFPGVVKWRPPLAAHIWWAPPHGDKNIGATHCDAPSNILHSYLLTLQKSVLFPFNHPIKMKLKSVVGWNWKHWPDLTQPILQYRGVLAWICDATPVSQQIRSVYSWSKFVYWYWLTPFIFLQITPRYMYHEIINI